MVEDSLMHNMNSAVRDLWERPLSARGRRCNADEFVVP